MEAAKRRQVRLEALDRKDRGGRRRRVRSQDAYYQSQEGGA